MVTTEGRRGIISHLSIATIAVLFAGVCMPLFASNPQIQQTIQNKLAKLEASSGGRIGLYALSTASSTDIQYRAQERFPFCSTFKFLVVSAILKKSMADSHFLKERVTYKKSDLISYSPITEKHLTDGMKISALCAAAIQSDNTATNLLLKHLGGPSSINAFARSIGDNAFRLDRWEPELNTAVPTDLRDTSTPEAMGKSLHKVTLGDALALPRRKQLMEWLKSNNTGDFRIRAGVPKGWIVGDKTGTGAYGTTNDVGIIWPPNGSPIIVAIFFTQNRKTAAPRDDVIASATSLLIREFARTCHPKTRGQAPLFEM